MYIILAVTCVLYACLIAGAILLEKFDGVIRNPGVDPTDGKEEKTEEAFKEPET